MQNKVDFLVNLWACNYLPWRPRCLTYFILQIERLEQKIRRQEKDLAETSNQVSQRGEHISNTVSLIKQGENSVAKLILWFQGLIFQNLLRLYFRPRV